MSENSKDFLIYFQGKIENCNFFLQNEATMCAFPI